MKHLMNTLMGLACGFLILHGIPNISIPHVGELQGFGQEVHAGADDFLSCLNESPHVRMGTRIGCGALAGASAFMGAALLLKGLLTSIARVGFKKALKEMEPITFSFPNKILGIKMPKSVAGRTFTINLADSSSTTITVLRLVLMVPIWELVYNICKCLVLERY